MSALFVDVANRLYAHQEIAFLDARELLYLNTIKTVVSVLQILEPEIVRKPRRRMLIMSISSTTE